MKYFGIGLLIVAFLSGCSTSGDVSDEALAGNPAAMLTDGTRLTTDGESLVSRGEERLADGREQVREGELLIDVGTDRVASARAEYLKRAGRGGQAGSPKDVKAEAAGMREVGDQWQAAIDDIRKGYALVEEGNEDIDRGQSEIREGRHLIERGSALVRNSERIRLGEDLLDVRAAADR